jgi:hypothetical protein
MPAVTTRRDKASGSETCSSAPTMPAKRAVLVTRAFRFATTSNPRPLIANHTTLVPTAHPIQVEPLSANAARRSGSLRVLPAVVIINSR